MILSERLESIISLVPKGLPCGDIGCDHGLISIELITRGISPKVIGSDLREGPLERAKENIKKAGLEDRIELRISNGFEKYSPGEIKTAVIAGMGGMLIKDILTSGTDVIKQMEGFIVQPQSNIPEFRRCLRQTGFTIIRNEIVKEDGKYYFPMLIKYTGECDPDDEITPGDRYGEDLIRENRGLSEYLEDEVVTLHSICKELNSRPGDHENRIKEIEELIKINSTVSQRMKKD